MKWARLRTLTEPTCTTPVRPRVRAMVRIVGCSCAGSRNPCAASAIRRAWAWEIERTGANLTGTADRGSTGLGAPSVFSSPGLVASALLGARLWQVDELLADGVQHGLHAGVQLELLEQVAHVVLHGVLTDEQPL